MSPGGPSHAPGLTELLGSGLNALQELATLLRWTDAHQPAHQSVPQPAALACAHLLPSNRAADILYFITGLLDSDGSVAFSDSGNPSPVSGSLVTAACWLTSCCTWLDAVAAGLALSLLHLALHWLQLKFEFGLSCGLSYRVSVYATNTAGLQSATVSYPSVYSTPPW